MSSLYPEKWLKILVVFSTKIDKKLLFSIIVRNFLPHFFTLGCVQQKKSKFWSWEPEMFLFWLFPIWAQFCLFFGHWNLTIAINVPYFFILNRIGQKRMRICIGITGNTKKTVFKTIRKWRKCAPSEALWGRGGMRERGGWVGGKMGGKSRRSCSCRPEWVSS